MAISDIIPDGQPAVPPSPPELYPLKLMKTQARERIGGASGLYEPLENT